MQKWLENQVQVRTDDLTLTDTRSIPPGWQERMTEEKWADYGRAWVAGGYGGENSQDIDEPDYQLPSSAVVNWGNGNK